PGNVRHVDEQLRPDLLRDLGECGEIDRACIRARTSDDHLRTALARNRTKHVVIDVTGVVHTIVNRVVQQTREIDRRSVREVPTLRQVQAQHQVARLEEGEIHRGVCLCARVRLHVRVLGVEQLLRAIDRDLLDAIHHFAATVVALAGKPFGVLVGKRRTHRLQDCERNKVLARNELETVALALGLFDDQTCDVRIEVPDRTQLAGCRHGGYAHLNYTLWKTDGTARRASVDRVIHAGGREYRATPAYPTTSRLARPLRPRAHH